MVFTTVANLVRSRGPDEFWRKRKIFKLAAVSRFKIKMFNVKLIELLFLSIFMVEEGTVSP